MHFQISKSVTGGDMPPEISFLSSPAAAESTNQQQQPHHQGGEASFVPRKFTHEQLAGFNKAGSAYIAVRGKVYDCTQWIHSHPGGPEAILFGAGRDSTLVFDMYHTPRATEVIKKFYIGDLISNELPVFPPPSEFSNVVRSRVMDYFRKNNLDPKYHPLVPIKYAVILLAYALLYTLQFVVFRDKVFIQVFSALLLGVACAQIGLHILHDASHFSFTHDPKMWFWMGHIHDFLNGCSYLVWIYQHIMGHHPYTNIDGADPDIHTTESDVRRIKSTQRWLARYINQERFIPFLYGVLGMKIRILDTVTAFWHRRDGNIRYNPPTALQVALFFGGKIFWFILRIWIPALLLQSWSMSLFLFAIADLSASYYLAIAFQVNHVVSEVAWPIPHPMTKEMSVDWAEGQVSTTLDYCHGSHFVATLTGGLNYQAIHHLFPGVNQIYYTDIAPIVVATAKEYNVPYAIKSSFYEALTAHLEHLKYLGQNLDNLVKKHT